MNITCFTDEISRDFETATDILSQKDIFEFDLRNLRTGRVPYISVEEEQEFERIILNKKYKINTISPGVGKLSINDPELKYKTICHLYDSIKFAKRHNIENIIIFTFRKVNKHNIQEKMPMFGWDLLEQMLDIGEKNNINLLIENHSSCFVSTTETILELQNTKRFANKIALNWDPNNSYQISKNGYSGEFMDIKEIVKNIHVKDTLFSKKQEEIRVPLGSGKVGWDQIFKDINDSGYQGKYTVETHYRPYSFNTINDIERLKDYLNTMHA